MISRALPFVVRRINLLIFLSAYTDSCNGIKCKLIYTKLLNMLKLIDILLVEEIPTLYERSEGSDSL